MSWPAAIPHLLHTAAGIQLLGTFLFVVLVARPALTAAGAGTPAVHVLDRRAWRLAGAALAVALLGAAGTLVLRAWAASGDLALSPSLVLRFLLETRHGILFAVESSALVLLAALLLLREPERDRADRWALPLQC